MLENELILRMIKLLLFMIKK